MFEVDTLQVAPERDGLGARFKSQPGQARVCGLGLAGGMFHVCKSNLGLAKLFQTFEY